MAIYPLFETEKAERIALHPPKSEAPKQALPKRPFSSISARLLFIILFIGDLFWIVYSCALLVLSTAATLVFLGKIPALRKTTLRAWISVKRALVCGLALIIALFSPAFGIMVASTYFLMYDKAGLEEVVPASIQAQFRNLFKASK